jgi:hypothetical protein
MVNASENLARLKIRPRWLSFQRVGMNRRINQGPSITSVSHIIGVGLDRERQYPK